jgi:hypothetical protein
MGLSQPKGNITKIDFMEDNGQERNKTGSISEERIDEFLDRLSSLSYYRCSPPGTYIGEYSIYIYYENGDVDVFGSEINGYIFSSGEKRTNGRYHVDQDEFMNMYYEYIEYN